MRISKHKNGGEREAQQTEINQFRLCPTIHGVSASAQSLFARKNPDGILNARVIKRNTYRAVNGPREPTAKKKML